MRAAQSWRALRLLIALLFFGGMVATVLRTPAAGAQPASQHRPVTVAGPCGAVVVGVEPRVTPTPTATRTRPTPTKRPSPTPTRKPSPTPTTRPSPTVTKPPSPTPTATQPVTPSPTITQTVTTTPSMTPSPTVTVTSVTPSVTPSPTVSATPTDTTTVTVTVSPSPTESVTVTTSPSPTASETGLPSPSPSVSPTLSPSPIDTTTVSPTASVTGTGSAATRTVKRRRPVPNIVCVWTSVRADGKPQKMFHKHSQVALISAWRLARRLGLHRSRLTLRWSVFSGFQKDVSLLPRPRNRVAVRRMKDPEPLKAGTFRLKFAPIVRHLPRGWYSVASWATVYGPRCRKGCTGIARQNRFKIG